MICHFEEKQINIPNLFVGTKKRRTVTPLKMRGWEWGSGKKQHFNGKSIKHKTKLGISAEAVW